jgi:hypothetical protein
VGSRPAIEELCSGSCSLSFLSNDILHRIQGCGGGGKCPDEEHST